jgi:sterol desaturase/sphingolipid hydroxylase (fatty acid hydroxylase superfamily)
LHDRNYGELITLWDRIFGTFSQHGGRLRVGLDGQAVPADGLLAQLWSPRFAA